MKFSFLRQQRPSFAWWTLALLVAALLGCKREDIRVYRVAKEPPPQAQAEMGMPAGPPDVEPAPSRLEWKLPVGWEEIPAGEMRLASFRVKGADGKQADVGIFPLPGMAGRDLDNVNRWRGQVGQPPITEEEMAKQAQAVQVDGSTAQVYDAAGENPSSGEKTRIVAAILRREGTAWFFKMNGDDSLVAQQKPAFTGFLESIKFKASGSSDLPPSHPPIGGVGGTASAGSEPVASEGKPRWQVPAGWEEVPGGQFLVAKFALKGPGNAQANVNVSKSAGDGGGLAANVNRWRRQIGLGELSEADLQGAVAAVDTAEGKAMFVDATGTDPRNGEKTRLVGAVIPKGTQTWFYKLMGNEQLVGEQKEAFTAFVKTARY